MDGSDVPDDRDVVVVRMVGTFQEEISGMSTSSVAGTVMTIVVDASTGASLDFGLGTAQNTPAIPDLTTLYTSG
jgi:hypothetical protein